MPSENRSLKKRTAQSATNRSPKKRSDAGQTLWTDRDEFAMNWIGQQYAIRLDQLQWLLGRYAGRGAAHPNWISEGAARDVVTRWKRAGWVKVKRIRAHEPFWIWPTRLGLRKVGLPYTYRDLEQSGLDDLKHLSAINEIRLHLIDDDEGTVWISERELLQGVVRNTGRALLHRPDAEIYWTDGLISAVEAELSTKKPFELAENLMELLRGEEYLRLKMDYGVREARAMSTRYQSRYSEIWYFAPEKVRKQVRRARARLVSQGDLSKQEAERLFVRWYPLAYMGAETVQEDEEENLDLADIDKEEDHLSAE